MMCLGPPNPKLVPAPLVRHAFAALDAGNRINATQREVWFVNPSITAQYIILRRHSGIDNLDYVHVV